MLRDGLNAVETSNREKIYAECNALLQDSEKKKQESQRMSEVRAQLNSANSEMNEQQEKYQATVLTLERELAETKRLLQTTVEESTALQQQLQEEQKRHQEQQQTSFEQQLTQLKLEMQRREASVMEKWRADQKEQENKHAEMLKAARNERDEALKQQRNSLTQEYAEKEHLLQNRIESLEKELQNQREQHKELEAAMRSNSIAQCDTLTMRTAAILHNYFESLLQQEKKDRYSLGLLEKSQRDELGLQHVYTLKEINMRTSSSLSAITLSLRTLETEEVKERNFILLEAFTTTPVVECEQSIFTLRLIEERRMSTVEAKLAQSEPLKALRIQVVQLRKESLSIASSLRQTLQESWRLLREGMKYTQQLQLLNETADAAATATAAALSAREQREEERQQQQQVALAAIKRLISAEEASESAFSCGQCFQLCRRPVTCVPCGHTFCESCLQQHPQNKKRTAGNSNSNVCSYYCPECRATTCNALLRVRALESLSGNFGFRRKEVEELRRALEKLSE
ncbi:uncharacterized protein TM35_000322040 [Trypanosoma theileri]|uniref:RING-type domain-containing protein n=1 Tax=Trypanosoma theileri TaxID=67003 RepID=A0A1X0NP04_9TRYP|nr:uncharacterized protein TM35_000322040 [Trypanosoma theileri]ORC85889.1 hypothetical protein TM35_000322040 [Trypanosoma theileri]